MEICSGIEALCNGKIIELVDWIDFLNWFNLRNTEEEIKPRHMCTRKVQGAIHNPCRLYPCRQGHCQVRGPDYLPQVVETWWGGLAAETAVAKFLKENQCSQRDQGEACRREDKYSLRYTQEASWCRDAELFHWRLSETKQEILHFYGGYKQNIAEIS